MKPIDPTPSDSRRSLDSSNRTHDVDAVGVPRDPGVLIAASDDDASAAVGPDLSGLAADREVGSGQRAARNAALTAICELLGKVATLVFTVYIARALGPADFGAFSYAVTFGLLLATLPSWGFDLLLLRRASADTARVGALLAQTWASRAFVSVPVLVVGGIIGAASQQTLATRTTVVLVLLASVLDTMGDAGRAAGAAVEQAGPVSYSLVVQRVSMTVAAVAVLALGGDLLGVAAAYLVSSLVGQGLTVVILRRLGVRPDWHAVNRAALLDIWHGSFYIGVNTLVAMALFRIDAVILHALKGDEVLAQYAVSYRLLETVLFLNWAVARATFPAMSRATGDPRQVLLLVERGFAAVAAVFIPYGVFLLFEGSEALHLLFGDEYSNSSAVVLRWLAFAPLTFGLSFLTGYALLAFDRNRQVLLASALGAAANISANLVLIPLLSGVGAALTTTFSYLLTGIVMLWCIRDGGMLRIDRALHLPVLAVVPMAGMLAVVHLPVLLEAVLAGIVFVVVYLLLLRWRDPQQMLVVRSLVRR